MLNVDVGVVSLVGGVPPVVVVVSVDGGVPTVVVVVVVDDVLVLVVVVDDDAVVGGTVVVVVLEVVVVVDTVPSPPFGRVGGFGSLITTDPAGVAVGVPGSANPIRSGMTGGVAFAAICATWLLLTAPSVSDGFAATDVVFGTWTSGNFACRLLRAFMRSRFHWSRRSALRSPSLTRIE